MESRDPEPLLRRPLRISFRRLRAGDGDLSVCAGLVRPVEAVLRKGGSERRERDERRV